MFYRDAGSGLFIRGAWNFPLEIQRFPNKEFLEFGLKTRCSGGILIKTKHILSLFVLVQERNTLLLVSFFRAKFVLQFPLVG